jgi:hypothetical protein
LCKCQNRLYTYKVFLLDVVLIVLDIKGAYGDLTEYHMQFGMMVTYEKGKTPHDCIGQHVKNNVICYML